VIALFAFQSCGKEELFETAIKTELAAECDHHVIQINLQGQTYRSGFTNNEWTAFNEHTAINLKTEADGSIMTFTFNSDLLCVDSETNLSSKDNDCEVLVGMHVESNASVRFDLDACTQDSEYLELLVSLVK